jgi:prophage regulatory protein
VPTKTSSKKPRPKRVQVMLARKIAGGQQPGQVRLLSKYDVIDRIGVSYPTLWDWMCKSKFPRSRELGGKICWLASEVEDWMQSRPKTRLKGDADTVAA